MLDERGFSLIEVLIALTIFAIGMLALAQMQVVALKGNTVARDVTEATTLAQNKIEELKLLPYEHDDLQDAQELLTTDPGFRDGGLDDTAAPDGPSTDIDLYGKTYALSWNVAEDFPLTGTKTIRVIVSWQNKLQVKQMSLDLIKAI